SRAAAAGNAGAGGVDATRVPVFAISNYPGHPTSSTSTPLLTLEAHSDALSTSAKAIAGTPSSPQVTAGQTAASASASCGSDGKVAAASHNATQAIDFGGVLRIGSVESKAGATVGSSGKLDLVGTNRLDGAAVLGQAVGITESGVVVGSSATPAPDDPLTSALESAGIHARLIAATKDPAHGQVLAPALEVTVTHAVSGFGTGPARTTYTFGRAYALATAVAGGARSPGTTAVAPLPSSGGQAEASPPPLSGPTSSPSTPGLAVPPSGGLSAPASPGATSSAGVPSQVVPLARIANASDESVYPALVIGAAVFAAAWFVFRKIGVGLRWN
ncbi:MAG: hypothetical protein ACYDD7_20355, partial [Acidimicrobiales bacterium]